QTFELLEIPSKRLRVFNGRRVVTQGRKRLDAEVHSHNSLVFAIGWSVLDLNRQAHKPTIGGARHHPPLDLTNEAKRLPHLHPADNRELDALIVHLDSVGVIFVRTVISPETVVFSLLFELRMVESPLTLRLLEVSEVILERGPEVLDRLLRRVLG